MLISVGIGQIKLKLLKKYSMTDTYARRFIFHPKTSTPLLFLESLLIVPLNLRTFSYDVQISYKKSHYDRSNRDGWERRSY